MVGLQGQATSISYYTLTALTNCANSICNIVEIFKAVNWEENWMTHSFGVHAVCNENITTSTIHRTTNCNRLRKLMTQKKLCPRTSAMTGNLGQPYYNCVRRAVKPYNNIESCHCTVEKPYINQPPRFDALGSMMMIAAVAATWNSASMPQLRLYYHSGCLNNLMATMYRRLRHSPRRYRAQRLRIRHWNGEAHSKGRREVCNYYTPHHTKEAGINVSAPDPLDETLCLFTIFWLKERRTTVIAQDTLIGSLTRYIAI